MGTIYKIGDSAYLLSNLKIIKVFITEVITKETLDGIIRQYAVRPYGNQKSLVMPEDRLYETFDMVKDALREQLKQLTEQIEMHLEKINDELFENAELLLTQGNTEEKTEE